MWRAVTVSRWCCATPMLSLIHIYTQQLVAIMTAATELGYEGKIVCGLDAAPSFNTTYGGDSVSYTHLDVYKRQVEPPCPRYPGMKKPQRQQALRLHVLLCSQCNLRFWKHLGYTPVSYTHLDVYKRQASQLVRPLATHTFRCRPPTS